MLLRCTRTWWAATRAVQSADARAPPPTMHRYRKSLLHARSSVAGQLSSLPCTEHRRLASLTEGRRAGELAHFKVSHVMIGNHVCFTAMLVSKHNA